MQTNLEKVMEAELTITRYNIAALIGWAGVVIGLVSATVQYFVPSAPGIYFLAVGLIGGGVTVTLAGPWRTVTRRKVTLKACKHPTGL